MANVIFDFDGTLADTFPLLVDVAYGLSSSTKRLPPKEIENLRKLPLLTALRRLGIPWFYIPRLMLHTRRRLTPHMQGVPPFKGVPRMLSALHAAGHQMFVLSSNYPENIRAFLDHNKLDRYFREIKTVKYANTWTKTRALRQIIEDYKLDPSSTYHVGNEALDMWAAKRVGIRGVATKWGGYDGHILKSTKPFAVIDAPSELVGLLAQNR